MPIHSPPVHVPSAGACPQLPLLHESVVQGLMSSQFRHEPNDPHCDTLEPDTQVEPLQHWVDVQHTLPQHVKPLGQVLPGVHSAC